MKKIVLLILVGFILAGCGKPKGEEIIKKFEKIVKESTGYNLVANMEIVSNEETYKYDVNVIYKEGDYYKVSLINNENSHEQIILKNEDGVYIITPALNKSFKFQSEWPYNSSQSYILNSITKDLTNDSERSYEENNDKYIFISKVEYPNNSSLKTQRLTFDKDETLEKVEVLDGNNNPMITVNIEKIDYKSKIDKEIFELKNNIEEDFSNEENVSKEIDDIVYPMYLPSNTSYQGEETINNDNVQRVILTFTGEKPFILVEETTNVSKDFEISQTAAELVIYENIIGNLTDTSLSWHQNGIDYYIVGQNLSSEELLQIASSTTTVALVK